METLRISLTVLPVGPRGPAVLDKNSTLTFALQATAGYTPQTEPGKLEDLWPWSFLQPDGNGMVSLKAWRIKAGSAPSAVQVAAISSESNDRFSKRLQDEIQKTYSPPPKDLDLHLYLPKELEQAGDGAQKLLAANFPSRSSFLSAIPGQLTRKLRATVYFQVKRDDLFKHNGSTWEAKDGYTQLWCVPDEIWRGGKKYNVQGQPAAATEFVPLFTQPFDGDETAAYGPGYDLQRFLPDLAEPVFDLTNHWLKVSEGDARFTELEAFLVKVLDPFSEVGNIPDSRLRGRLSNNGRPLDSAELACAIELWRIQALLGMLARLPNDNSVAAEALGRLVSSLGRDPGEVIAALGEWQIPPGQGLMDAVWTMARLFRLVNDPDARQQLRAVAELATLGGVCRWVESALDVMLAAGKFPDLEAAWRGGGDLSSGQRADWRRARVQIALQQTLEARFVRPLLDELKQTTSDPVEVIRNQGVKGVLKRRWAERLSASVTAALAGLGFTSLVAGLNLDLKVQEELDQQFLDGVWPPSAPRATGPAHPIPLVMGETQHRLVHQDNDKVAGEIAGGKGGIFNEVTGHALLVRRHEDKTGLAMQPWRLVSGGVATVSRSEDVFVPADGADNWLAELLPIAEENVFVDGLLRSDRGYEGQLRHIQSPLEPAYNAAGAGDAGSGDALKPAYTYQGMGPYAGQDASSLEIAALLKAPPLRFGDWYEFAAFVIDAAGGVPTEIARADEPWRIDPKALNNKLDPAPAKRVAIPYRRGQAVGDVNILPGGSKGWPRYGNGVVSRAREWQRALTANVGAEGRGNENVPEVLLWQGSEFEAPNPSYIFYLEPPSIDEFTLRRWVTPLRSATEADKDAIRAKLIRTLTRLYTNRNQGKPVQGKPVFTPESMVHDPAVHALGFRVQVFDDLGKRQVDEWKDLVKVLVEDSTLDYRYTPIPVELSIDPTATAITIRKGLKASTAKVPLAMPPGWFAAIDVWPLVISSDFTARFEHREFFEAEMEDGSYPMSDKYVAFRPVRVLCEVASPSLPDAEDLYRYWSLKDESGKVRVQWEATQSVPPGLPFVDRYRLVRERWQWRNRPVLADLSQAPAAERARLAASGLPREAFDPKKRDEGGPVAQWEEFAALDNGFPDRGDHANVWTRLAPQKDDEAGGPASSLTLLLDDRDGVAAGDYLRYQLEVTSRYAPILRSDHRRRMARHPSRGDGYRRIAAPFRGGKIKSPKILSVLPLTRSLPQDPLHDDGARPTPFLVLLDETWFREYGAGERLQPRLVLENLDINEPDGKRPYRAGPLPDHWLAHDYFRQYYRKFQGSQETDDTQPMVLDAFGPFGYSLDASPEQALANASAFVVYPPHDVGPHHSLYVQFRRVLDLPNTPELKSDPSDVYALYTLPDENQLAQGPERSRLILRLDATGKDYAVQLEGLALNLNPLAGSPAELEEPLKESLPKSTKNYRYFLIVSEAMVLAGQNEKVERPLALLRVKDDVGIANPPIAQRLKTTSLLPQRTYRGRILEVLLNGIYRGTDGKDRLSRLDRPDASGPEGDISERAFWDQVLTLHHADEPRHDAAGMIRRISRSFTIEVE